LITIPPYRYFLYFLIWGIRDAHTFSSDRDSEGRLYMTFSKIKKSVKMGFSEVSKGEIVSSTYPNRVSM